MSQSKQVPVKLVFSIFADVGVDIQGEERGSSPCIYWEFVCCITDVSHNVTVATSHAGGCNNLQWECRYPKRSGRTHCTVPVWFPAWTQESKYPPPPVTMPSNLPHRERFGGRVLGQLIRGRPGGRVAQLCGPGGDAEFGLHHRLLPAERHHASAWHPDGQVWATPHPPGRKVKSWVKGLSTHFGMLKNKSHSVDETRQQSKNLELEKSPCGL